MDDFDLLESYFNHMIGKTTVGVGVIDDELVFTLNDMSVVTLFSDNDLSLNIRKTN